MDGEVAKKKVSRIVNFFRPLIALYYNFGDFIHGKLLDVSIISNWMDINSTIRLFYPQNSVPMWGISLLILLINEVWVTFLFYWNKVEPAQVCYLLERKANDVVSLGYIKFYYL